MIEPADLLLKKIENTESDFRDIFRRMDVDADMWEETGSPLNHDYEMLTKAFQPARETEVDFISNNPATYADNVGARLSSSDMQVIVRMMEKEGQDRRDDVSKLERLFTYALEQADDRLVNLMALTPLKDFLIWSGMIRGRMAVRTLVRQDDGVIFDILPLDPRYFTYQIGKDGMKWGNYKTFRSASDLKDEYGADATQEKDNEVNDYWEFIKPGEVWNTVFCKNVELLKPQKHKIPMLPLSYVPVPNVPPLRSRFGKMVKHGDSIYGNVREIYKFENELISMWASHAKLMYKQPTINYMDDQGTPLETTAFLAEAVINIPMGHNKLEASPVKDISPTIVNLVQYMNGLRQRGSLPDVEFGEVKGQMSGTAINELQQARNRVYGPLIHGMNVIYSTICKQIEKQMISNSMSVKIETELERKYYAAKVTPVDLKEAHIIRVEFTANTPWNQLDTYQIADMAKNLGLPDEFIWEYILKLPDPKGLTDQIAVETAEHSPDLLRLRAIKTMVSQGRTEEIKPLIEDMYTEWQEKQQAQMGGQEMPQPQTGQVPQQGQPPQQGGILQ